MKTISTFILLTITSLSFAQKSPVSSWPKHEIIVGGGLTQPTILGGGNIQLDYLHKRFSFDYSHGFNLNFNGGLRSESEVNQRLNILMPWTTGFGVGYRFTRHFSVRVEPKLHAYEVRIEGQSIDQPVLKYKTATLGLGAYYRWLPFEKSASWAKGITIMPSVRYWPNVWSSLKDNKATYYNTSTAKNETIHAGVQGVNGLVLNVTVGYSFWK